MINSWEKIIDPNFINAELIGPEGAEKDVTITDIDFAEAFDQKSNSKRQVQTVFFSECKPMVLNKTNAKQLRKLFDPTGQEPKRCVGKKITLYVVPVKVGREMTIGIRIKECNEIKCEACGSMVAGTNTMSISQMAEYSKKHCNGRILCLSCMKKYKEESKNE